METDPAARAAEAARLLSELADVSADGAKLEACRLEAAAFSPHDAAVDLVLDLLNPGVDPEGLEESFTCVDALIAKLVEARAVRPALRLLDGLARLEAAERDLESERARRLKAALAGAFRATQRGPS